MGLETNIIKLFPEENKISGEVLQPITEISQSTQDIVNEKELKLHESFSYGNVLAALVQNRYISKGEDQKREWLESSEHDYHGMMKILYQYILNSLNEYYTKRWLEVYSAWSTLNSLTVLEKDSRKIKHKFSVELYLHTDWCIDIEIFDQDWSLTAMISKNQLSFFNYN